MLLRRPLFWATVLAGAFAFYEQGHESLGIVNDPAALHTKKDVNISGILVSPVRRARMGWWTLIDFSSGTISSRAQLWLPTAVDPVPYEPGRTVEVTGQLRRARRPRNPGDYNEQSRLEALGAVWVLRASHAQVSAGSPPPQWLAHDLAQRVKLGIEASFYRQLSIPRAALLSGILLGDIGGLGREDSVAIRNSGGTHLLVVSGLKVSFIAAIAVSLGLALGLAPGLRSLLAISVGGFYTLMAACDPPSLRAWMMLTAGAGARTLDRAISPSASLTLAAFILLMADPAAALSPGSLMSFGGTAALLAVVRRLEATAPTYWPRVLRHVWVLVGINLAITIALWPLFAAVFGRGSLIGPLANVALVPIACSLMGSGLILWVFDRCIPVAAYPIVQITDYGLSLFEMVCRWAAHYPWSSIELRQWHWEEVFAYGLLLAVVLAWPRRWLCAGLVTSALCLWTLPGIVSAKPPITALILSRKSGSALISFSGRQTIFVGPRAPDATMNRVAVALGVAPIQRTLIGRKLKLRLGRIEMIFGDRRGFFTRDGQDSVAIMTKPRVSALALSTDGQRLEIKEFFPEVLLKEL